MLPRLRDIVFYWKTYQLVRTILPFNSTIRYLSKSYLVDFGLEYNRQEQLWDLLYKEVRNPPHYPSVVDTRRINTIALKVSMGNSQQIPFGKSQDPCAETSPVRYKVIIVVLMHLITFQEPIIRMSDTVWMIS